MRPRLYEDFGNFNYGATGAAAGYSLGTLQRMAGWVQQHGGDASSGSGTTSPGQLDARMGLGGIYPYGDELRDSQLILFGIATQNYSYSVMTVALMTYSNKKGLGKTLRSPWFIEP